MSDIQKVLKTLEMSEAIAERCVLTCVDCGNLNEHIYNLNQRIAELESKQRWISVKERLPEDSTMVLFTDGVTKGIGKFSEDGFYDYWYDGFFNKSVTHWMPLPESPNDTQKDTVVYGKEGER